MEYTSGNFEAFSTPLPPRGNSHKQAYIVGSGLSALAAACFIIRDGGMPGENVHILEKSPVPGGACDGYEFEELGYVSRGERGLDERCECMWELLRSIPSGNGGTVLDDIYLVNKNDPNYSLCRTTVNRGEDTGPDGGMGLSDKGFRQIIKLFITPDEKLYGKKVTDVFNNEVLSSRFWTLFRTQFFFENWHSALELKRYLRRFLIHFGSLSDLKGIKYTKMNEYESIVVPMLDYLKAAGVSFRYGVQVTGVAFDCATSVRRATRIDFSCGEDEDSIDLTEDDLVFITLGGGVENTGIGSQDESAPFNTEIAEGGSWDFWRQIAAQDNAFGRPDVFATSTEQTSRMTATITVRDRAVIPYIKKICRRDPFSGHVVTGGPVTAADSSWLISWSIGRQPQYPGQKKGEIVIWLSAVINDTPGDRVAKPMRECSGREICEEWLYHIGVPEDRISAFADGMVTAVPVMMPFAGAALMPRSRGDRPDVVPEGAKNFAFIGQFAETSREAAFTSEYAFRTAMEAVYSLLGIRRGMPESFGGTYDVRFILDAAVKLRDGRPLKDLKVGIRERLALRAIRRRIRGTDLEKVMKEYQII